MKILIIDNHDSFTYNLYQQIARVSGVEPHVVSNDGVDLAEIERLAPALVVISPGPGRPEQSADFGVCGEVLRRLEHIPILGICLGFQGLAWMAGGEVIHAREVMHGRTSSLVHVGRDLFEALPQGFQVVRYHSLVVAEPLPDVLEALAHSRDGVLMAVRHRRLPRWGVQFHPESICTEHGDRLIANALKLAGVPLGDVVFPAPRPKPKRGRSPHYCLIDHPPPAERIHKALYGDRPHQFWLDSSLVAEGLSRYSLMGDTRGPGSRMLRYTLAERRLEIVEDGRREVTHGCLFQYLREQLQANAQPFASLPFPFCGGYVGYLGYELKASCGGQPHFQAEQPDAAFLYATQYLAFDHERNRLYLVSLQEDAAEAQAWFQQMRADLAALGGRDLEPSAPPAPPATARTFRLSRSRADYLRDIARCMFHIQEGETYEVCLTQQIEGFSDEDPLEVYRRLRRLNPAPYAAYLRFDSLAVLSSSPEQFLRVSPLRAVSAKPIKGTRPRHRDPRQDARIAAELAASIKDRAENLMIVDLLRNDLGKVCQVDSVRVPKLMAVESYRFVHQLVSTITGRLKPEADLISLLQAAFPGGSMTGAPKERTMEIIDALELGPRGIYSGCIGYLGFNGAADLSIVIRSAVVQDGRVRIGTGGAVVALSDGADEFEETLLKASAIIEAFGAQLAE